VAVWSGIASARWTKLRRRLWVYHPFYESFVWDGRVNRPSTLAPLGAGDYETRTTIFLDLADDWVCRW